MKLFRNFLKLVKNLTWKKYIGAVYYQLYCQYATYMDVYPKFLLYGYCLNYWIIYLAYVSRDFRDHDTMMIYSALGWFLGNAIYMWCATRLPVEIAYANAGLVITWIWMIFVIFFLNPTPCIWFILFEITGWSYFKSNNLDPDL